MMGNEVFINMDCRSVKCSESSRVLPRKWYIHLARCWSHLEERKISRYLTSPSASQLLQSPTGCYFSSETPSDFPLCESTSIQLFRPGGLNKVLQGRNHLINVYISHNSRYLMIMQQMTYNISDHKEIMSEWIKESLSAEQRNYNALVIVCFIHELRCIASTRTVENRKFREDRISLRKQKCMLPLLQNYLFLVCCFSNSALDFLWVPDKHTWAGIVAKSDDER